MGRRRFLEPCEIEITSLGNRGVGLGVAPDGKPMQVRGAPVGSRVAVQPSGKRKGVWNGRRTHMVRPPVESAEPQCSLFGLCGGCVLQEMNLEGQRKAKEQFALSALGEAFEQATRHEVRGSELGYRYRNKVELSFGTARFLSESDHAKGLAIDGRFVGFHAPGRFDRVVDATGCELISPELNELLVVVRQFALKESAPMPWNTRDHSGFWRHLLLREGQRTGQRLVGLYTASPPDEAAVAAVRQVAEACIQAGATGVVWMINDGKGDVARGPIREVWGSPFIEEKLGEAIFKLSVDAFFQTSTSGAEVLMGTLREAVGTKSKKLLDLYCGTGAIGICLSDVVPEVQGIEVVESSVLNARENAKRSGVQATFRAAKVEDVLSEIQGGEGVAIIVDPPRAGLHPKVAAKLAKTQADVLIYVACNPASLGRDGEVLAAGGWSCTDVWVVDLFPQTGHVETVARFVRQ